MTNEELKNASGSKNYNSKLTSFLYELMRDHIPPGIIQEVALNSQDPDVTFSNGWLAEYANYLAENLTK